MMALRCCLCVREKQADRAQGEQGGGGGREKGGEFEHEQHTPEDGVTARVDGVELHLQPRDRILQ